MGDLPNKAMDLESAPHQSHGRTVLVLFDSGPKSSPAPNNETTVSYLGDDSAEDTNIKTVIDSYTHDGCEQPAFVLSDNGPRSFESSANRPKESHSDDMSDSYKSSPENLNNQKVLESDPYNSCGETPTFILSDNGPRSSQVSTNQPTESHCDDMIERWSSQGDSNTRRFERLGYIHSLLSILWLFFISKCTNLRPLKSHFSDTGQAAAPENGPKGSPGVCTSESSDKSPGNSNSKERSVLMKKFRSKVKDYKNYSRRNISRKMVSSCAKRGLYKKITVALYSVLMVSSGSASVTLSSDKSVVTVGGTIGYTCKGYNITSISWYLNWTLFTKSSYSNVQSSFSDVPMSNILDYGHLFVDTVSIEYSNTSIFCIAMQTSGSTTSNILYMKVQGLPPVVSFGYTLQKNKITVNWDPVSTLDIPDIEPDVSCCVNIYNSTNSLLSECNLTNVSVQYVLPDSFACGAYNLTVDAVNVVGRTNSTSVSIINTELEISYVEVTYINSTTNEVSITMKQSLCSYSVFLTIEGQVRSSTISNSNLLTFNMRDNDRFLATVQDLNNLASNVSTQIKTFDVNLTIVAVKNGTNEILLSSTFIIDSLAKGVLYVFLNINNNVLNFSNSLYILKSKAEAEAGSTATVPGGIYRVLSFDVEQNYTIQNHGYPADIEQKIVISEKFYTEPIDDNSECEVVVLDQLNFTVRCSCSSGSHYQAIFQKCGKSLESADTIITKRANCTELISFQCDKNAVCHIKAFPEYRFPGTLMDPNDMITTLKPNVGTTSHIYIIIILTVTCVLVITVIIATIICYKLYRSKTVKMWRLKFHRHGGH